MKTAFLLALALAVLPASAQNYSGPAPTAPPRTGDSLQQPGVPEGSHPALNVIDNLIAQHKIP